MAKKKSNPWIMPFKMHNPNGQIMPVNGAVKPKSIFDELLDSPDADTMLVIAACHGNANIMQQALAKGANVNTQNGIALRYAAESGFTDLVKDLLARGAKPDADDSAAFRWACRNGYLDIVEILHKAGANIHVLGDCGLQWAIDKNKKKVVDYLQKNNCEIEPGSLFKEEQDNLRKDEVQEKLARMAWRPEKEDPNDPYQQLQQKLGNVLNGAQIPPNSSTTMGVGQNGQVAVGPVTAAPTQPANPVQPIKPTP